MELRSLSALIFCGELRLRLAQYGGLLNLHHLSHPELVEHQCQVLVAQLPQASVQLQLVLALLCQVLVLQLMVSALHQLVLALLPW